MIAKVKNKFGYYHEALVNLWTNINYFIIEISVRMNEFTHAMHCQNPKMKKLCKYFILNLTNMIYAYVQLDEIGAVYECYKLIEWLNEAFFEERERFYKQNMEILNRVHQIFLAEYEEKCELTRYMTYIARNKVKDRQGERLFPDTITKEISIYGYIPKKVAYEEDEKYEKMNFLEDVLDLPNLGIKIDPIMGNGVEVVYEKKREEKKKNFLDILKEKQKKDEVKSSWSMVSQSGNGGIEKFAEKFLSVGKNKKEEGYNFKDIRDRQTSLDQNNQKNDLSLKKAMTFT